MKRICISSFIFITCIFLIGCPPSPDQRSREVHNVGPDFDYDAHIINQKQITLDSIFEKLSDSIEVTKIANGPSMYPRKNRDTVLIFNHSIDLRQDTITYNHNSDYKKAIFKKPFSLILCTLLRATMLNFRWSLWHIQFESTVSFVNNYYQLPLGFYDCKFQGPINFTNYDTVREDLQFYSCQFDNELSFRPAGEDPEYAIMMTGSLNESNYSNIKSDIFFYKSELGKKLDFSYCHLLNGHNIILKMTNLPDTLDLSHSEISGSLRLDEAYPNKRNDICQINLLYTNMDKIRMTRYQYFHLYFPDSVLKEPGSVDMIAGTYEALLNNFKRNGYSDSYRKLDIEYKEWKSGKNLWMWISSWWWKFGYEKWRVLIWSIGLLLIFSLINIFLYEDLMATYNVAQLDKNKYSFSKIGFLKYLEMFWVSVMYTGFVFFKISFDFDKITIVKWRILMWLFFQYVVGLVCTAYILNWIVGK